MHDFLYTLQKLKYDIHIKLPLESYQIQFWYDSSGNLVWISYEFGMIPVAIWYEYHTNLVWFQWQFGMNIILQFLQYMLHSYSYSSV